MGSRKSSVFQHMMGALAKVLTAGLFLWNSATALTAPAVQVVWNPAAISFSVEPNGFRSVEVSFAAQASLANVTIFVVPELQPFVDVVPAAFAGISLGETRKIRISAAMYDTIASGNEFEGTIHLRISDRTIANTLKVLLKVPPPSAQGTLQSVRSALEAGDVNEFAKQFVPDRQATYRQVFLGLTPEGRSLLSQALNTAQLTFLSDDQTLAIFAVTLQDTSGRRFRSTITLLRDDRGIWRIIRL